MKKTFNIKITTLLLLVVGIIISFVSCCPYSFTGASVPAHLNTIAIPFAEDRSGSGEFSLRDDFTNELIKKFIEDGNFSIAERQKADALLDCTISTLIDAPHTVSGSNQVDARRVTIRVKVTYRDMVERKTIYEKTFENYSEYPASDPTTGREQAIQDAIDKITEDILLDTVSGW